jgi:hypothetical protein
MLLPGLQSEQQIVPAHGAADKGSSTRQQQTNHVLQHLNKTQWWVQQC